MPSSFNRCIWFSCAVTCSTVAYISDQKMTVDSILGAGLLGSVSKIATRRLLMPKENIGKYLPCISGKNEVVNVNSIVSEVALVCRAIHQMSRYQRFDSELGYTSTACRNCYYHFPRYYHLWPRGSSPGIWARLVQHNLRFAPRMRWCCYLFHRNVLWCAGLAQLTRSRVADTNRLAV